MNKEEHFIIGIFSFIFYFLIINLVILSAPGKDIISLGILSTIAGSIIPDILEPPKHWTHRNKYHSKTYMKKATKLFIALTVIAILVPVFMIMSGFFLGYITHLLADSTTTVGLPK